MNARKAGLFLVMLGALTLSFSGQVASVTPLLDRPLAVVFALTNDLASLLALHEVTTASKHSVRAWAWSVLFLAGGTALGLNTWHALATRALPAPAAVAVGAGPVVLAWVLSHLVALVAAARREAPAGSTTPAVAAAVSSAGHTPDQPVTETPVGPRPEIEVGSDLMRVRPESQRPGASAPETGGVALIDRAERLERQALAETGRGVSFRQATRRLDD